MKSLIVALVVLVVSSFTLVGCQVDLDLGTYATPRISVKNLLKDESANHAVSRGTGVFGNGHTVTVEEQGNSGLIGWGRGSSKEGGK